MDRRRSFSRTPRQALSREERKQLIAEMLGEEFGDSTTPVTEIVEPSQPTPDPAPAPEPEDTLASSFDALDALDAQGKALEDAGYDLDDSDSAAPEEDDGFEALLAEFGEADVQDDTPEEEDDLDEELRELEAAFELPEPEIEPEPEQMPETAPLALEAYLQPAEEPESAAEPEPEMEPEPTQPPPAPATLKRVKHDTASQEKLRAAYELAKTPASYLDTGDRWDNLDVMPVDVAHLERNLVITASRNEPAHGAFDVLRTRLVQTLLEHNWKRVAITSPSRNCGKTFTAVNLAISLSRYEASRTILLDFDMRNPSVAGVIGDTQPGKMGDFLRGIISAEDLLVKFDRNNLNIGPSLAIGTNNVVEPYASELAHEPTTGESLDRMMQEMSPDIVLFDMPPALAFDDVIAFRKHFDGVLMVVGGGETRPEDVREVMRRMGEETPLLGVVLNQAEGEDGSDYSYGY